MSYLKPNTRYRKIKCKRKFGSLTYDDYPDEVFTDKNGRFWNTLQTHYYVGDSAIWKEVSSCHDELIWEE